MPRPPLPPWDEDDPLAREDRYWDAVVRGEPPAGTIDPAVAEAIERVHRLDDATGPDPAFVARLEEDLMHAFAMNPPIPAHHQRVKANGRATLPPRYLPLPTPAPSRPRGRWALTQFATALLLLVTLGGVYVAFMAQRSGRDGDRAGLTPNQVATPSPSAFPTGDYFPFFLELVTVDPGARPVLTPDAGGCCPGPVIDYILEGTDVLRVDGPLHVARASRPGTFETVPTGTAVTLGPGDATIHRTESGWEVINSGTSTLRLLHVLLSPNGFPGPPVNWNYPEYGWVSPPPAAPLGALDVTLQRVTLAPDAILQAVPGDSLAFVPGSYGASVTLAQRSDGSVHNLGREAAVAFVLTLHPAGSAPGTRSTGG
jgi:hypothetical protein